MLTTIIGQQIRPGTICRVNLNTTVPGCSIFTRLLVPAVNPGVVLLSSTGADPGTGDVTVDLNYSYLGTLYATQAWVLAQHYLSTDTETDPVFKASAAYAITSANIGSWNVAFNKYPKGLSIEGTTTKTVTLTLNDNSTVAASFSDLTGGGSQGTSTLDQVLAAGNTSAYPIVVGGITSSAIAGGAGNSQYVTTDANGMLQLASLQWAENRESGFDGLVPAVGTIMDFRDKGMMQSNFIPANSQGEVYIVADKDCNIVNIIPGSAMAVCLPIASKYPGRIIKLRVAARTSRITFTDAGNKPVSVVVMYIQSEGAYQFLSGISDGGSPYPNEWLELISANLSGAGDYYWLITQYK